MSSMLELALKAKIPIIRATTDDPVNFEGVLQSIAQVGNIKVIETFNASALFLTDTLLVTFSASCATTTALTILRKKERSLVCVNTPFSKDVMLDVGEVWPPMHMVSALVKEYVEADLSSALTGMSLKSISELLSLTAVRFGAINLNTIRAMRALLGAPIQGLYPVDLSMDFYFPNPDIESWLALNHKYFLSDTVHRALRPRGILLEGKTGTGKSMASKNMARAWGLPLYRLDLGTSMGKYVGQSEERLASILNQVEGFAPCILLVDEIEKVFQNDDDGGVSQRMLSQLLWWLAEHRARVLTVMTTNDKLKIPPELYRSGRINKVLEVTNLNATNSRAFAVQYLRVILAPQQPTLAMLDQFDYKGGKTYSPAQVTDDVLLAVKKNNWLGT